MKPQITILCEDPVASDIIHHLDQVYTTLAKATSGVLGGDEAALYVPDIRATRHAPTVAMEARCSSSDKVEEWREALGEAWERLAEKFDLPSLDGGILISQVE